MAKKKDWELLKMEYMAGNNPNVEDFLRAKGINPNGGYATLKTNGWATERREKGEKAMEAFMRDLPNILARRWIKIREETGAT